MADRDSRDPPSPFIVEWIGRLGPGRGRPALDVATGRGRHAIELARAGFRAFGVDRRFDAVRDAVLAGRARGLTIHGWCADLTQSALPQAYFDLVVVTRYLQRDLFGSLASSLRPGGVVLYETFTTAQIARGRGPRSPEHLLEPGELRGAFPALEVVFYEEVDEPDALARLAARR